MEIFKDIPQYGGRYQISNYGRVWSVIRQKYLKPVVNSRGYCVITLYAENGKKKNEAIHRLVALTFLDNPNKYPCVNHKDEDKTNNNVDNLEWCSWQYNNTYNDRHIRAQITRNRNWRAKKELGTQ